MSKIYSFNRNDKELFEVEFASLPPSMRWNLFAAKQGAATARRITDRVEAGPHSSAQSAQNRRRRAARGRTMPIITLARRRALGHNCGQRKRQPEPFLIPFAFSRRLALSA
jgi:hypothetical protein